MSGHLVGVLFLAGWMLLGASSLYQTLRTGPESIQDAVRGRLYDCMGLVLMAAVTGWFVLSGGYVFAGICGAGLIIYSAEVIAINRYLDRMGH